MAIKSMFYVGGTSSYVIVEAPSESEAKTRALQEASRRGLRLGEIRTIRQATRDEIELQEWHDNQKSHKGVKSMKKKNKAAKPVKTKDLPPEEEEKDLTEEEAGKVEGELEEVQDDLADETADTEEKDLEPYSSQVLRRLHEDGSIMMKDYDEMNQILEHPEVKDYLTDHLTGLEKHLSAVEKLHGKHHKDLPPIVGADEDEEGDEGEKDLEDDEAVEADSGEKEEPTPEEVIEGMEKETKRMPRTRTEMESRYPESSVPPDWLNEYDTRYEAWQAWIDGKMEMEIEDASREKAICPKEMKALRGKYKKKCIKAVCPECGKEGCTCGKKALTEDEAGKIEGELENVQDDLADETSDTESKGLEPHEKKKVGEAVDYLKDIGQEGSEFGDEHRMKAYHYSKSLEDIGEMKSWHKGLKGIKGQDSGGSEAFHTGYEARVQGEPDTANPYPEGTYNYNEWEQGWAEADKTGGKSFFKKGIKGQPSEDISPEKARQILKDGTVHGKPLTDKQRGLFGAAAGKGKSVPGSPEWEKEEANEPEHKNIKGGPGSGPRPGGGSQRGKYESEDEEGRGYVEYDFSKPKGEEAEYVMGKDDVRFDEEEKSLHPHRKMCKDASGFFKALAFEKAFGDNHRAKAIEHAGNLGSIMEEKAMEETPEETYEPGEMGQKSDEEDEKEDKGMGTKALKNIYLKQNKEIEELAKKFSRLAKV